MPMAPVTLTDAQVIEVETLAALLSQEQIADYFGISRRTFQNILDRDEEVAARYKRGKAKAIAHVANGLLQKARSGHTASMIFYLKTQAGWREDVRPEEAPHAVAGSTGAVEKLRERLDALARRQGTLPAPARAVDDMALEAIVPEGRQDARPDGAG